MHGHVLGLLVEEVVLEFLNRVVERLHRLEMAVHDEVEQSVQQEADAVLARSGLEFQRSTTLPMSRPSSLRMVISAAAG